MVEERGRDKWPMKLSYYPHKYIHVLANEVVYSWAPRFPYNYTTNILLCTINHDCVNIIT